MILRSEGRFYGNSSFSTKVVYSELEELAQAGTLPAWLAKNAVRDSETNEFKFWLHCERPRGRRGHNLGDRWAVDRVVYSFHGKDFQRFHPESDMPRLRAAVERGCA